MNLLPRYNSSARRHAGLLLALSLPTIAAAQVADLTTSVPDAGPLQAGAAVDETPRLWFIELSGAPAADGAPLAAVRSEKAAFRQAANSARIVYRERFAFDSLWNGFSVEATPAQLVQLRRLPGVTAVYPVEVVSRPEPDWVGAPDLATAVAMTGADIAQNSLGLTGTGIKVGVIDTGIDVDHPAFGGGGVPGGTSFPSTRVAYGYDFVGDAFNADATSPGYNPVPMPDPNPDDCGGHGTHVAGIVGASGPITGVAPGVTFGAYRVFGCDGSTTTDIILAALERAKADGMEIINMSLGAAYQWPQYPTAQASDRLVRQGTVVVASAGNNGQGGTSNVPNSLYSLGAPGVGKDVIGVASYDNTSVTLNEFTISPDDAAIGYQPATASPLPPDTGTYPMARTGTTSSPADACDPLAAGSLAGKVALIRRGGCTFYQKAANAMAAGASGVVLYNNTTGRISATVAGATPVTIPVVTITAAEGAIIDGRLAVGPVDLTWTANVGSYPNPTGNLISSFSSFGLAPDLSLKPDLGAPGGSIYSAYPLERGGFATLSGTSMAAPHVAGAVALLLEARPETKAREVVGLLQNSADPKPWGGNPGLGFLDNVHRQGAGMLDIDDAILSTTTVSPSELALGESEAGPRTATLTIANRGPAPVTYQLSSVNAISTGAANNNGTYSASFFLSDATVTFASPSITVWPNGRASVNVTISPPSGPTKGQYGGYLVLTDASGGPTLRVPYAGFVGDYQSIRVLVPTVNGFPWLAQLIGGVYYSRPEGGTYSMVGDDVPYYLVHLDHYARKLALTIIDTKNGRKWTQAYAEEYLPRNVTPGGFFAFAWDGTTTTGKATHVMPDGSYVLQLSVLKANGDEKKPAHWETWISPTVTLQRP